MCGRTKYRTGSSTVGLRSKSARQGQDQRELLERSSRRCYEASTRPDVGLTLAQLPITANLQYIDEIDSRF